MKYSFRFQKFQFFHLNQVKYGTEKTPYLDIFHVSTESKYLLKINNEDFKTMSSDFVPVSLVPTLNKYFPTG